MRSWWRRFRAWVTGRAGMAEDLAEEIQAQLEMAEHDLIEHGLEPEEAHFAARRRAGNTTLAAERARDAWGFPALESFFQDIRYGMRAMRRSPGFALVVILTLALGIGVNTAIFSVLHSVLLKPLPYPASERLVWLGESTAKASGISVTWVNFQHWRNGNHTFEEMAAFQFTELTLTGRREPLVTRGLMATAPYLHLLGVRPLLGRLFSRADDQPGAPATIVLSHRFWAGPLGADPHIVGTALTLNGIPYEVVGVAAPVWQLTPRDYFLPLGQAVGGTADRARHGSIRVLGRLRPGVTLSAAQADLDAIMRHLAEVDPGSENLHTSFGQFLAESTAGGVRGVLLVLMGAAALILLIACANVASLLLARNTARAAELALRRAIGAGRLRLIRQLLTENLFVISAGGLAGIAIAWCVLRLLVASAPIDIPRLAETTIDLPVLLFACAATFSAGVLAGLAPVVTASQVDLTSALKEGSGTSGTGRHRQSLRNLLVVGEVALTFVLAFGSGLLLRSLIAAQTASPGFDTRGVLTFHLQLPPDSYRSSDAVRNFYTHLLDRLRTVPGVAGASAVNCPPGVEDCGDWFYSIAGRPAPGPNEMPISLFNSAVPGYFQTLRVPLREGREFAGSDRPQGPEVAIVNETFARTWWPRESAIGHQIKVGGPNLEGPLLQIIGIAGDVKQAGLDQPTRPEIYLPAAQRPNHRMAILIRSAGDPHSILPAARRAVYALDRNLPLQSVSTFDQTFGASLARRRFSTFLISSFAGLAMLLAAIGIYGMLSYWVKIREPEIAVRLALGAPPARILRWTGGHALQLAATGIAAGLGGAWAAIRVLQDLVFGVAPADPATLLAAALAVLAIALAAAALPALRASHLDPVERLHHS